MIIVSRCPYRISLLGGGTDLEWFLNKYQTGISIGLSTSIYSRVIVSYRPKGSTFGILNYSSREEYSMVNSICHPIVRSSLENLKIDKPIEMASFGEFSSGSGLGSSSSFTVALIKALSELKNQKISNIEAAKIACNIEIDILGNPIGRQDQYLCALGGVNILKFKKRDVEVIPNDKIYKAVELFVSNSFLINTGLSRSATEVLKKIKSDDTNDKRLIDLFQIAQSFIEKSKSLEPDKILKNLEDSIKSSWEIKKSLKGVMNNKLIEIEDFINTNNFKVYKLLGAGAGGYFLAKYNGENLNKDINNLLIKGLDIKGIEIDKKGCEIWKI